MQLHFTHQSQSYLFDSEQACDISLPLRAGNDNPNCYYASPVGVETIRQGAFVGNVAEGGPCNYQQLTLTPHGNGTHTECYGHLSADPAATVWQQVRAYLFLAELITLPTRRHLNGDQRVTFADFERALGQPTPEAVVIRTLPNGDSKRTRQYSGTNPPYLEPAICGWLADAGVKHLLVDLPSVDRESDGGLLAAHRAFWQFPHQTRREATITELIYVDNALTDGRYLLQLQVTSLCTDASPSRPVMYPLQRTPG
ncbi:MAG: cyclase family protein [Ferruginibacter sp.]|nr:cyclase family protein [Cytophagales bacterium]